MSATSDALESQVGAIKAIVEAASPLGLLPRQRTQIDRHYARLLRLIAPRVRHFIRAYGLFDHNEDAEQACAIGLFRAIEAYDRDKARFTTFLNWQLRGELQSLRFRLRYDTRESARKVGAVTLSYDALCEAGEQSALLDTQALGRTEALAADALARRACGTLVEDYMGSLRTAALARRNRRSPPRGAEWNCPGTIDPLEIARLEARLLRERAIVTAYMVGDAEDCPADGPTAGVTAEQARQIARRAIRAIAASARGNPRFDPDALAWNPRLAVH